MNELEKKNTTALTPVTKIKQYLANVDIKKRFEEMLGKKAPQFMSSIITVVSGSTSLQDCDPNSIMSAAFVAASFDLPIDPNLGFSAIVPYLDKAQFQMMYKGFIQLAMRSGQYKGMNYAEIYSDEIEEYDPITRRVKFVYPRPVDGARSKAEYEKIAGYYSWFVLMSGFEQSLFMTCDEIRNHAKKYSKAYQYDISKNKKASRWSQDFDVMAKKTVIKLLLSKWGILSIDMQRALTFDQQVFTETGEATYADNPKTLDKKIEDPFKASELPIIQTSEELTEEDKAEILAAEKAQS